MKATTPQQPPLRQRNIALPSGRLSPLMDKEEPLPPIPFARTRFDDSLEWGDYRVLPSSRSTATSPETGGSTVVGNARGREHEARVYPNSGATAVPVPDVIGVVEEEMQRAARLRPASSGYPYCGQSVRGADGF